MQGCMASKMSSNTWLESLCQHSRHALAGREVRAADRTATRTSCENGDGADGRFKRRQACECVTCESHLSHLTLA